MRHSPVRQNYAMRERSKHRSPVSLPRPRWSKPDSSSKRRLLLYPDRAKAAIQTTCPPLPVSQICSKQHRPSRATTPCNNSVRGMHRLPPRERRLIHTTNALGQVARIAAATLQPRAAASLLLLAALLLQGRKVRPAEVVRLVYRRRRRLLDGRRRLALALALPQPLLDPRNVADVRIRHPRCTSPHASSGVHRRRSHAQRGNSQFAPCTAR